MPDPKEKKPGKKRTGRRAYLNDFKLDEQGKYVYRGKMMGYEAEKISYGAYLRMITISVIGMLLFTVGAECLPAVSLSRFGLTVIPWLGQMAAVFVTAYGAFKILTGRNPMRSYVYRSSVEKMDGRLAVSMMFSFFTAFEETIYILVKGCAGEVLYTVLRPVCSLICGCIALFLRSRLKECAWGEVPNPLSE